ncbi:MAG: hypothetical protein QOE69_1641 [Thermoleophilaceae bacterium]|jgi:hypothetical protein|nr:hypothetical protein [Thermoleophilaceae bacterium]
MPYTSDQRRGFERASPLGHVPTIQHPLVAERLQLYVRPKRQAQDRSIIDERLIDPAELDQDSWDIGTVAAVDGSPFEQEVEPDFPATRALFIQVAGVAVDLERFNQRSGPFADPVAVIEAQEAAVAAGFLPSSNLPRRDGADPLTAFREELYKFFAETVVQQKSLLDMLIQVEAFSPSGAPPTDHVWLEVCPNPDCRRKLSGNQVERADWLAVPRNGCECPACATKLLPTDALRVDAAFRPYSSNLEAAGRVMTASEHLTYTAVLTDLASRLPAALRSMAFITDGPLALFGEVAPIKRSLLLLLQNLAEDRRQQAMSPPVVLGVEKSGEFVDHALAIRELVPAGRLMLLDDDYIARHIRHRDNTFGEDTYYGRKFFYRTRDERMLVITVPPLAEVGTEPYRRGISLDIRQYPTLKATCGLLDRIGTRLFDDALIPIALAHSYAAYPLRTAGQVLKLHTEQHLGEPRS